MSHLSNNTKAILLLTAPLIIGKSSSNQELLTPGEYKRLAKYLRERTLEPADLLSSDADSVIASCAPVILEDRMRALLQRGFQLAQAVEVWGSRAIWVISRADAEYPRKLKLKLREDAPALLYGCGDLTLLEHVDSLAVVGSRNADESLIDYTESIGRLTAQSGAALVSGGARGVDQAAMRGAGMAGGLACGVVADSLDRSVMQRENRNAIIDGKLILVSPFDPKAAFNVGNAMQRNKVIYALADAALIVNADLNKGGTWNGAVEQIRKYGTTPVYVRSTGAPSVALQALTDMGARLWPNPETADEYCSIFQVVAQPHEEPMMIASEPLPKIPYGPQHLTTPETSATDPAETLFIHVRDILVAHLGKPTKEKDVAAMLNVSTAQTKVWLQRLAEERVIEKTSKGYVVSQAKLL